MSASLLELTHEWHHNGPPSGGPLPPPSRALGSSSSTAIGSSSSSSSHPSLRGASSAVVAAAHLHTAGGLTGLSVGASSSGRPPPSDAVVHVCCSPAEDALAVVYADGQLRWCPVRGSPSQCRGDSLVPVTTLGHRHSPGAHLTGLDVCVRKPLAATCALDRTVRVWDYLSASLELTCAVMEDPLCVAFHPSGLHLAVGFPDKLRLHHVLVDDLRVRIRESARGRREGKNKREREGGVRVRKSVSERAA